MLSTCSNPATPALELRETISLRTLVSPWRYALRHTAYGALWFAVALGLIALWFSPFLAGFIGFFVAIVALPLLFAGDYGKAHQLAHSTIAIQLDHEHLSVERKSRQWSGPPGSCRFFRGSTNHDPDCPGDVAAPALILSWPPYSSESRTICALGAATISHWIRVLSCAGAIEESDRASRRPAFDAFRCVSAGLVASLALLSFLGLLSFICPVSEVQWFIGPLTAAVIGGRLCRHLIRHFEGDCVANGARFGWWDEFVKLWLIGFLGMRRGAANIVDPMVLFVGVVIVAVEVGVVLSVYQWLRKRELMRVSLP